MSLAWEDVIDQYDTFNEDEQKKHYLSRAKEQEYFNQLYGIWHTHISRLGLSFKTTNGLKEWSVFKPVQFDLSPNSKAEAQENRLGLAQWENNFDDNEDDVREYLQEYVPKPITDAYKKFLDASTPGHKKDRSGSALMLCFSQKWNQINRSSMLLDPEGHDKIVNIADIIIAARDTKVSIPFRLESLTGWKMLEGELGNDNVTNKATLSSQEIEKVIKRLSKRIFARLDNLTMKYSIDNAKDIELYFQVFLASMKLNEARLQSVIEGKLLFTIYIFSVNNFVYCRRKI
jgi:hypothetical protein